VESNARDTDRKRVNRKEAEVESNARDRDRKRVKSNNQQDATW
jgi:hypothetical protein